LVDCLIGQPEFQFRWWEHRQQTCDGFLCGYILQAVLNEQWELRVIWQDAGAGVFGCRVARHTEFLDQTGTFGIFLLV
jgi:hypothetical protein